MYCMYVENISQNIIAELLNQETMTPTWQCKWTRKHLIAQEKRSICIPACFSTQSRPDAFWRGKWERLLWFRLVFTSTFTATKARKHNDWEGEKFIPHKSKIFDNEHLPLYLSKSQTIRKDSKTWNHRLVRMSHRQISAKDDQQSTNNEMCNGEDSEPRHHHFEKKESRNGGNPMLL